MQGKRRIFTVVLALFMVIALTFSASAAWPSFQNNNTNNGVIAVQPPITTPSSVTTVELPSTNAWIGIDAASVIGTVDNGDSTTSTYVYTLYNGGDDGAMFAATDITVTNPPTPAAPYWEADLDSTAQNVSQLSTPYIQLDANGLAIAVYAATTTTTTDYDSSGFDESEGWEAMDGAEIEDGTATFASGATSSITSPAEVTFSVPVHTILVQTDLTSTDENSTYTVILSDGTNEYVLVPDTTTIGIYGSTYYTYNGDEIPAGTYTVTLEVTAAAGDSPTATYISLGTFWWKLNKITNLTSTTPSVVVVANGEGQSNTPINADSTYIYWGIWGGTRSYYQLPIGDTNATNLKTYTPSGDPNYPAYPYDNFYWAGAYSNGTNVYFGSDSGTLYRLNVSTFTLGGATYINSYNKDAGSVRSTLVFVPNDSDPTIVGSLYFTTFGKSGFGYLVSYGVSSAASGGLTNPLAYRQLPGTTASSSPVISANGYLYVGWYTNDFTSGGVVGISAGFTDRLATTADMFDVYGDGAGTGASPGDPVQASPIVFTSGAWDYVYFTTNSALGAGYCNRYNINSQAVQSVWTVPGTSSNRYAVQGFASDGGYLVYGDDGNYLYIMH